MIQILSKNISVLSQPVRHHSAALTPMRDVLVHEILIAFAEGSEHHVLEQHSSGIGSWELRLSSGQSFHFRAAGNRVVVKDAYMMGSPIEILRTPEACRDWVWKMKLALVAKAA